MTDFLLHEKFYKIIREIPKPRLMFRKGVSVRGFFRPYMSLCDYTEASVFSDTDKITPVTARFSSLLGDKGTADTVRNIRSMNVRFHISQEERYDMLCRSLPVYFINDASKLTQLMDSFTVRESFDGLDCEKFWRFVISNPESVNCVLRLFSHEGLTDSFVDIRWYSENTYIWKNSKNERFLVRCRWYPVTEKDEEDLKGAYMSRNEAEFMAGFDPDRAVNGIETAVREGHFPSYELQIQMMVYTDDIEEDILKYTCLWDETKYPYVSAGVMKFVSEAESYRNDCDMLSFIPSNTIEGIGIYRDELSKIFDWIYKVEAIERGAAI